MLDGLAASGAPTVAGNMMSSNRALRSARDAVDAHHVWELDPDDIMDDRYADRLDPGDIADLRSSIEVNGQTVPILVRRHATLSDRYLLVYGRRRLEAIRGSDKVGKIRALIANLDDDAALRAQVSENTGRRDLSYIERALFARELLDSGFGNQSQIAEVLNATRSAVSMAISVARAIGPDLAQAIGPAHGIGRPRWEAMVRELSQSAADIDRLAQTAHETRHKLADTEPSDADEGDSPDPSAAAFEAVYRQLRKNSAAPRPASAPARAKPLTLNGQPAGNLRRTAKGLRLDLNGIDAGFAAWFEDHAQAVLNDLHARWHQRPEDDQDQH